MDIIKTYLLNCSFHGIPYIGDNRYHWTERIFWIIMVLLSWWASVNIMLSAFDQFHNSAVSFTVDTLYLKWESNYPAFIFCETGNFKHIAYSKKWFSGSVQGQSDLKIGTVLKEISFPLVSVSNTKEYFKDNGGDYPFIKSNLTQYAEVLRSTCQELFSYCSWNYVTFSCCEQIMPINTIYGQCYALNSIAPTKTPSEPLYMNVSHKPGLDVGNLTIEVLNPDLKVLVLSHEAVPLYADDASAALNGIASTPHYREQNDIYLAIEEIVNDDNVKSISINRRGCRFIDENNLNHSKIYSHSACAVECIFEMQMKLCNCYHHLLPSVDQNYVCDLEGLICLEKFSSVINKAAALCPCDISCIHTEVKIIGIIPTNNYASFYNNNTIVQMNFILRAPTVRCVRSVVYGYLDLIVSVGGTAGLCVGASILTTVEIFYYFIVRPMSDYILKRELKKKKFRIKKVKNKNAVYPFVH